MPPTPELRLLLTFLAVARRGSFSQAARDLSMTQQSVSEAMRKLETQLGYELFERSRRGVTLTAAGHTMDRELPEALAGVDRAIVRTSLAATRLTGRLAVGCSFDLESDLHTLIAAPLQEHPGLEVAFSVAAQTDLLGHLRRRHLDLALTWQLADDEAGIERRAVRAEPLTVFFRSGHPLDTARDSLSATELSAYPLIMHEREIAPGPYDVMMRAVTNGASRPLIRHVPIYTSGHRARLDQLTHSDAIALGATSTVAALAERSQIATRPLRSHAKVEIIWAWLLDNALAAAIATNLLPARQTPEPPSAGRRHRP